MLLDTPTQVHIVLKKYVKYIEKTSQVNIELLITLIFNLALAQFDYTYKYKYMDADKKDKDYKAKKEEIKKIVDEINNLVIKDFD